MTIGKHLSSQTVHSVDELAELGRQVARHTAGRHQRRQAARLYQGEAAQVFETWRGLLMSAMAALEASIDFPDEADIPGEHPNLTLTAESLSLTTLVHVGADVTPLAVAQELCRPRLIVFLDEPAWQSAAIEVATTPFSVPDPHRAGQVYEGWWGTTASGSVVGKAPQHPTMHRLYRAEDLTAWLRAAPRPREA